MVVDLTPEGDSSLLFMHIPKTGGTTMRRDVGAAYGASERAFIYEDRSVEGAIGRDAFAALPESERARPRLVFGHYHYGIHADVPGESAYATMVRDPVDRVVSVFEHYRNHKGVRFRLMSPAARSRDRAARERARIEKERLDLESWIFERRAREADNQMVRLIAGNPETPFGECDDALLARAIEHLDTRFALVLVQDQLPASLARLSECIGRPISTGRHLKVNRRRRPLHAIEPRVRDRISELNRLDRALYDLARVRLADMSRASR